MVSLMKQRLYSVVKIEPGEIDDTRWEKVVMWFGALCQDAVSSSLLTVRKLVEELLVAGLMQVIEAGLNNRDSRVVACVLRLVGLFVALPDSTLFSRLMRDHSDILTRIHEELEAMHPVDDDWNFGAFHERDSRKRLGLLETASWFSVSPSALGWMLQLDVLPNVVSSSFSHPSMYVRAATARLLYFCLTQPNQDLDLGPDARFPLDTRAFDRNEILPPPFHAAVTPLAALAIKRKEFIAKVAHLWQLTRPNPTARRTGVPVFTSSHNETHPDQWQRSDRIEDNPSDAVSMSPTCGLSSQGTNEVSHTPATSVPVASSLPPIVNHTHVVAFTEWAEVLALGPAHPLLSDALRYAVPAAHLAVCSEAGRERDGGRANEVERETGERKQAGESLRERTTDDLAHSVGSFPSTGAREALYFDRGRAPHLPSAVARVEENASGARAESGPGSACSNRLYKSWLHTGHALLASENEGSGLGWELLRVLGQHDAHARLGAKQHAQVRPRFLIL
jgi:hypothetical protein